MKRIIPFLTIATIAVAVGMSSSAVTWATTEALSKTAHAPETGWTFDGAENIPIGNTGNAALNVSAAPIAGTLAYNISEAGTGYSFILNVLADTCSITGTEPAADSCVTTNPGDTGGLGRLCGTDAAGLNVYEVLGTSSHSTTDDTEMLCSVNVKKLGKNAAYVAYVPRLTLEHVQYLNIDKASVLKSFTSPEGDYFIAIAKDMKTGLPSSQPARPQAIYIYKWNSTTEKFDKTAHDIPAISGKYVGAIEFFNELIDGKGYYLLVAYTDENNGSAAHGESDIVVYHWDKNSNSFKLDDAGNEAINKIDKKKGISDMKYFVENNTAYLLVVQGGTQQTGYNQKAHLHSWNSANAFFNKTALSASNQTATTYGGQEAHMFSENGIRYFIFGNQHNHTNYNVDSNLYAFSDGKFTPSSASAQTYGSASWATWTVPSSGGSEPYVTYLLSADGEYNFKHNNNPKKPKLRLSSGGQIIDVVQEALVVPTYLKGWDAITLGGSQHYILGSFSHKPTGNTLFTWCSADQIQTDGHWCKGKTEIDHVYEFPLTIPTPEMASFFSYDWETLVIDGETYLIRVDNTLSTNSTQILKANLK